jgi:hypothetical protein
VDRATFGEGYMTTEDIEAVRNSADNRQLLEKELAALRKDHHELATEVIPTGDASWPMPVNLKRLIWNAQKTFTCGHPAEVTGLSPVEVAQVSPPERPGPSFVFWWGWGCSSVHVRERVGTTGDFVRVKATPLFNQHNTRLRNRSDRPTLREDGDSSSPVGGTSRTRGWELHGMGNQTGPRMETGV